MADNSPNDKANPPKKQLATLAHTRKKKRMNELNENEVEPGQGASERPRLEPSFAVGAVVGGHVDGRRI